MLHNAFNYTALNKEAISSFEITGSSFGLTPSVSRNMGTFYWNLTTVMVFKPQNNGTKFYWADFCSSSSHLKMEAKPTSETLWLKNINTVYKSNRIITHIIIFLCNTSKIFTVTICKVERPVGRDAGFLPAAGWRGARRPFGKFPGRAIQQT